MEELFTAKNEESFQKLRINSEVLYNIQLNDTADFKGLEKYLDNKLRLETFLSEAKNIKMLNDPEEKKAKIKEIKDNLNKYFPDNEALKSKIDESFNEESSDSTLKALITKELSEILQKIEEERKQIPKSKKLGKNKKGSERNKKRHRPPSDHDVEIGVSDGVSNRRRKSARILRNKGVKEADK